MSKTVTFRLFKSQYMPVTPLDWITFSSDRNTPLRRDGERFEQSLAS
jgi:hypothetical protein